MLNRNLNSNLNRNLSHSNSDKNILRKRIRGMSTPLVNDFANIVNNENTKLDKIDKNDKYYKLNSNVRISRLNTEPNKKRNLKDKEKEKEKE